MFGLNISLKTNRLTNLLSVVDPGSLFKTRCMSCGHEATNYKSPICAALEGKG